MVSSPERYIYCHIMHTHECTGVMVSAALGRGGFRGGEGAAAPPPLSSCNHSEKGKFWSQPVKSNILLSQNAGNAISETLDVHNFAGGGAHAPGLP